MKRVLAVLLAFGSIGVAASAAAQDDVEARARAHFAAGQAHVAQERYREAYFAFSGGYGLSHRPLFLFNMAECAYHAGIHARARRDYERYLEADPNGAMAQTARERLEELGPAPAPQPERVAQAEVARVAAHRPLPTVDVAPLVRREIWQEEAFWGVLGASLAAVLIAVITGIALTSMPNGPACGPGCTLVDFR